jgi:hypothetical protein
MPIPLPEESRPSEPARRPVHATFTEKRNTRAPRTHRELSRAPARATASAPAESAAPVSPHANAEPASQPEVAAAPERKPISSRESARPEPAKQAQAPDDLAEMQQVATAEQLVERAPDRALALVRQGDQRFAHGYFQQERAYIAIMALIGLGRTEEARARAATFAKRFPALPYGARIRSALDARKGAAAHE